jgi:hypothetical protein
MTKADQARWRRGVRTYAMARYIARRAVEEEIRREGGKVARYSAKQLIERADDYIEAHRDAVTREVLMRRWLRRFEPMSVRNPPKFRTLAR